MANALQPGLTDEENDVPGLVNAENEFQLLSTEEHEVLSDRAGDGRLKAEDVIQYFEQLGPMEHEERLKLIKASFGIPSEPEDYFNSLLLPQCTRDLRHVGDGVWHSYYRMDKLCETNLPPMRYTHCEPLDGNPCFHEPTPILQIFNIKLQSSLVDLISPVEVYGIVAVRDDEDNFRNYLFNRPRENPLEISLADGHIRLLSPKRGMSMKFDCLIEVDIRMKTIGDDKDDKTLVDGCMELVEGRVYFDSFSRCTMKGPFGCAVFDMIMFRNGVEATIQLNFLEVPQGRFSIQMCGYTTVGKHLYSFIDKNCEFDGIISSAGKLPQYFIAAMRIEDNFLIDFKEGKAPLAFKSTLHGNEEKTYSFDNGALVSVKVSWSTAYF